jgi:phage terminase large subunit-like protein
MPWQRLVADVALEVDPATGRLAYRTVVLTIPRQCGKTTLLLAVWLQRAVSWERQNIAWTMQNAKDAREKWEDEHVPAIQASPLSRAVEKVRRQNGSEAVMFRNGSIQRLMASTTSSGHGKVLDLGVVDEAFAQPDDRLEQAMRPAMRTRPQPQMWLVSTAGDAASEWFHGWCDAGRAAVDEGRDGKVAYFEWSADPDADPGDPATWWSCMPALGYTVTEDAIQGEYDQAVGRPDGLAGFRRASLNQRTTLRSNPVFPLHLWDQCVAIVERERSGLVWSVDVSPEQASASICVGWTRSDGLPQVQLVEHRPGVGWLPDRVSELRAAHGGCWLLDPRGASGSQAEGWPGRVVTPSEAKRACSELEAAVREGALGHYGDEAVRVALDGAVKRPSEDGGWSWARRSTATDISPLVSFSLCVWGVRAGLVAAPAPILVWG